MSLFGWPEKRRIAELEERDVRRLAEIAKQAGELEDLKALAEGRQAVIRQQAGELAQSRREAADLGQMLTREVAEAVEDVTAAEGTADGLRKQLADLQVENARLLTGGDTELRRRLARSEAARFSLQGQLETLQMVNESLNAEGAEVADRAWRKARQAKPGVTA